MSSERMTIKVHQFAAAVCIIVMVVLGVGQAPVEAVTCNALQLSSCANPILYGQAPSKMCCDKLKEQRPCFCQYLKDPTLSRYVNSPNAKKLQRACGVQSARCS